MMNRFVLSYTVLVLVVLLLYGCAQSGTLSGGPKDTDAPVMDIERSSSSEMVNYAGEPLVLLFDEYIVLKDPKKITVSPPTKYVPITKVRGKRLTFHFNDDEVLKENITYRIDFDNAIADFTEGNAVESLTYILGTGDKIDSLELDGEVVSTGDELPSDLMIMLYENHEDSVVVNETPLYYQKVESDGTFQLKYLREGTYKVVALKDNNANYLYDLKTEWIGFMDDAVILPDTSSQSLRIPLFRGAQDTIITDVNGKKYGRIDVTFSIPPEEIDLAEANIKLYPIQEKEKLTLWYSDTLSEARFVLNGDTTRLKLPKLDTSFTRKPLKFKSMEMGGKYLPGERLVMVFDRPVDSFNVEQLLIDSLPANMCADFKVEMNTVSFLCDSLSVTSELTMLPGMVVDIYGSTIDTSLSKIYQVSRDDLVNFPLTFKNLNPEYNYLLTLITNEDVVDKTVIKGDTLVTWNYNDMKLGSYDLRIVEDSDDNGAWSTGDYWSKKLPERKVELSLLTLSEGDYMLIDWDSPEDKMLQKIRESAGEDEDPDDEENTKE